MIDWGNVAANVRAWVDSGGDAKKFEARTARWQVLNAAESDLFRHIISEEDLGLLDYRINMFLEQMLRQSYPEFKGR